MPRKGRKGMEQRCQHGGGSTGWNRGLGWRGRGTTCRIEQEKKTTAESQNGLSWKGSRKASRYSSSPHLPSPSLKPFPHGPSQQRTKNCHPNSSCFCTGCLRRSHGRGPTDTVTAHRLLCAFRSSEVRHWHQQGSLCTWPLREVRRAPARSPGAEAALQNHSSPLHQERIW